MQVLHVITSLGLGGAQVMLRRYLSALGPARAGHSVVALLPGGDIGRDISDLGVRVHDLGISNLYAAPRGAVRLRRLVERVEPDVVHGWMYHGCLAASLFASDGRPVVWGIHHSLSDIRNESAKTRALLRILGNISSRPAAIAYCGPSIADQHEKIGFSPKRRVVIPNGTDCSEFRPVDGARRRIQVELGLPPGRVLIGNLTRNHPMKDPAMLVRALARLTAAGLDAQVIFMGDGHVDGPARAAARNHGVDDRVTTLPARKNIAGFVAGLDLFALSSAWGEAFPLALAEAMAAGVPVVSTDVGDTAWLVGQPDQLVPPGDDAAMARAIERLLQLTEPARHAIAQAGRARVSENFSLDRYIAAHDELYQPGADRISLGPVAAE